MKSILLFWAAATGADDAAVDPDPSSKPSNSLNGSYEGFATGAENESPSLMSIRSISGAEACFG